ncbi:MAG: trifunctional transcriptional regulator/proline dehydrogenase/L-glutamate gamma-semialdehyde dehydrogenase [Proteobacteria bacterium]|nr:trifunctional transcriptional regulator/proline dehydrogenase/L-glutamate gamma-semialdehyde dehydrogenase [Pseudomonadota bacterium]
MTTSLMAPFRMSSPPFHAFARSIRPQTPLRAAITSACRRLEPECLPPLIAAASLPAETMTAATSLARTLVGKLRGKARRGGVEGLIHEYALSSQEGVALMCLAEALLRIPDDATRDALIRDKIAGGDWEAHLGHSPSLFVNAATWGLMLTGRLAATHSERGLSSALTRLIARGGEPLIRSAVNLAMRLMGEQFVAGQTIDEALERGQAWEARGFRYSYDMLGEAAVTEAEARRYFEDYRRAIDAIGVAGAGRGPHDGPGISVKLSALHARYSRAQIERVQAELYPRLKALAVQARSLDIGLNIDAEEADRLEISLDLLERLCFEPELDGWNGIGFVVQAYQKRCPFVIDWLVDLARRSRHRLMVRLVKGAYWDGEIKRAQLDGLDGFPVFTRKMYTDVSYIACARKLLAATDAVYPQFATHNALTLATIFTMAGPDYRPGQYEFQCLHGMGESLYEEVVGRDKLDRPCRIYAPVGTHETLLAYLVRRLLENGANTSFVHQIADTDFPVERLLADPVERARTLVSVGAPHERIALPRDLFKPARLNSMGMDLASEQRLAELAQALTASAQEAWHAAPHLGDGLRNGPAREVRNPANLDDVVGTVIEATPELVDAACARAVVWQATPEARAACLERVADRLEARMSALIGLIVREAGKTFANAIGEVREAVDFLRYYANEARGFSNETHRPLGLVACISPWNFPLSIFTGQIAGALAAGNAVIAKPAKETPLIAAQMVRLFLGGGLPPGVLQLVPGDGAIGARLVANPAVAGVVFTGSTEAARSINRTLARRLGRDGKPIPLIAETGGQNALVADSSALAEQLVGDAIVSAFDSAGQRCSALRILCLQDDIADRVLAMLKGAMDELSVGNPDRLSTDMGPVISPDARQRLLDHIERMREDGHAIHQPSLAAEMHAGLFVPPTLIEIESVADLPGEVFGPVLHVMRYPRERLEAVIREVNRTGFGLTFGVHSRIDETVARATEASAAGNQYVNRNLIGAVVGVQPFGGHGLSGTGPKAGGPLYLLRLLSQRPAPAIDASERELVGPVGERNSYRLRPGGTILCVAHDPADLQAQFEVVRATGNRATMEIDDPHLSAALFAGDEAELRTLVQHLAQRDGPIVPVHCAPYPADFLFDEIAVSVNTAAAGGNASLMAIG